MLAPLTCCPCNTLVPPGEVNGQHLWLLPLLQMKYHTLGSDFSAAAKGAGGQPGSAGEIMFCRWTSPYGNTGDGRQPTNTFIPHSPPETLLQGMAFLHISSRANTWCWETGWMHPWSSSHLLCLREVTPHLISASHSSQPLQFQFPHSGHLRIVPPNDAIALSFKLLFPRLRQYADISFAIRKEREKHERGRGAGNVGVGD